jgi:hypothetical protein
MNMKKVLPIVLFIILALVAIGLRRCNNEGTNYKPSVSTQSQSRSTGNSRGLDRNPSKYYFTKHARCRMDCRHITQREVKAILANGTINYSKSNLQDNRGPTYAVEGTTEDRQRVRIIFAPKQRHMSVVTVIDLDKEYDCDCK